MNNYYFIFSFSLFRYLSLNTAFTQTEFLVTERTVSFSSPTYIQALSGRLSDGRYRCQLKNGSIQADVVYNTLEDFESCSVIDGGFSSLSNTFNDTSLWSLTGYNGQCSVMYGLASDPPMEPLVTDSRTVGGKVFYRLGDIDCTMGK